jgi:hypothetical protein
MNYTIENVDIDRLTEEIQDSSITIAIDYIEHSGSSLDVYFKASLSQAETDTLDAIISAHTGDPLPSELQLKIKDQILGEGTNKRLKLKGYSFAAPAGLTTNFDFTMPFDGNIQGGKIFTDNLQDGDEVEFIIAPDTPSAFKYVETCPVIKGAVIEPTEMFSISAKLALGTPMRVVYINNGSGGVNVGFTITYRL